MNLIPSINDYDLYLFVFHPEQLGVEKKNFIAGNEKYEETINHFKELQAGMNYEITHDDKELLASKIAVYLPNSNIIELYPAQTGSNSTKQPKVVYRAASVEVDEKLTSKTLFDSKKMYMVKANINHRTTKIYIFSGTGEILKNITLRIYPGGTLHHLDDNTQPLVLEGRVEVEHMSLEIG